MTSKGRQRFMPRAVSKKMAQGGIQTHDALHCRQVLYQWQLERLKTTGSIWSRKFPEGLENLK